MHPIARPLPTLVFAALLALPARSPAHAAAQEGRARQDAAAQASSADTRSDEALSADSFSALDTDHDGRISSAEAAGNAAFDARFSRLDGDGDGYVSQKEYRAGLRATRTPTSAP